MAITKKTEEDKIEVRKVLDSLSNVKKSIEELKDIENEKGLFDSLNIKLEKL